VSSKLQLHVSIILKNKKNGKEEEKREERQSEKDMIYIISLTSIVVKYVELLMYLLTISKSS
jgi:hypothetical protein